MGSCGSRIGMFGLAGCLACSDASAAHTTDVRRADEIGVPSGVPDRDADPAVVAIQLGGLTVCAGSLIAPDVVLTARHCVSWPGGTCPGSGSTAPPLRDPSSLAVSVTEGASDAVIVPGRSLVVPESPAVCAADLALLLLARPIDTIEPLSVRRTGVAQGDHVRTVVFAGADGTTGLPQRLARDHVAIMGTTDTEFVIREGPCASGCGGPAIDEDSGKIVGVLSRPGVAGALVSTPSFSVDLAMRADAFLAVIDQALAQASPVARSPGKLKGAKGPLDMGGNCAVAADCAAGVCVSNEDRRYCSRTCAPHDRCPARYVCQSGVVTSGTPLPGEGQAVCIER